MHSCCSVTFPRCGHWANGYLLWRLKRFSPPLQVFNEIGESEWSKPVAFTTSASVPDPPHGLEAVESTTDSIALHWQVCTSPCAPHTCCACQRGFLHRRSVVLLTFT